MQILSLSLTNFRPFKRLEIEFSDKLTLFYGKNAQGKTSILEAVNFLSILTSPIAGYDRELINFLCLDDDQPVSRITASIKKAEKIHRIEVRLILDTVRSGNSRLRKEVLIDGVKRRLFDVVGFFNSVIFLPQMTRIIEDGPEDRRRYLDQTLSQALPGYLKALSHYMQGITRRNALLKLLSEKGGDVNQLTYWDKLISENGAILIQARSQAVLELSRIAEIKHGSLTKGTENLKIAYRPAFNPWECGHLKLPFLMDESDRSNLSIDEICMKFQEKLTEVRHEEMRRGITTIGPHRDDLQFSANGIDLGIFGSRGQIRTAIMSLKFAEMDWLQEKSGDRPVLLLDETLAELDLNRRSDLLHMLQNGKQAIITTADLELFDPGFIDGCMSLKIEDGRIIN
jgi:DNA replication and repair protein RecF